MSTEWPTHLGDLSAYTLQQAIEVLEKAFAGPGDEDVQHALAVIRMVAPMPRRSPWYGQPIDPDDGSVTVGVMMRNAFEAVGDSPDEPPKHWLTKMYLARWRRSRAEYYDFLEHLLDPVRAAQEAERSRLTQEQAAACERSIRSFLRAPMA